MQEGIARNFICCNLNQIICDIYNSQMWAFIYIYANLNALKTKALYAIERWGFNTGYLLIHLLPHILFPYPRTARRATWSGIVMFSAIIETK